MAVVLAISWLSGCWFDMVLSVRLNVVNFGCGHDVELREMKADW